MADLLANLNHKQRAAVKHTSGPLLVIAGAGTGKTTVLINRLLYLIQEVGLKADEILLTTFTEKAVGELTERADRLLPYGYTDLWIYTFHGLCERLLREHALDIGLNPDFKLLNTTEQWILIKKNLDDFDLNYYRPLGNPTKFIAELIKHFSRLKDEDISAAEYLAYAENLESDRDRRLSGAVKAKKASRAKKISSDDDREETDEIEVERLRELANAFHVYNQLLLKNNFLDFGDLIIYTLKLFRDRPNILQFYQRKFKQIMVDEFQDTNYAQYELMKLLAAGHNNLLVTGDDDQAVYRFRGASIANIMQFKDDYPQAQEVLLTDNYRSNQEILDYAYHFIQNNNPNRLETKLGLDKKIKAKGEKAEKPSSKKSQVSFHNFATETEEASFVSGSIKDIYQADKETAWSDFAILVRSNAIADKFVKELNRHNIPNEFVSLRGLYYKPIILDCLAYLKLLDNYHESSALFRVLNMEVFKVSYPDLITINKFARRKVWSLYETLKNAAAIPEISPESLQNINKLLGMIEKQSTLAVGGKTSRIFLEFVKDSGLLKRLDRDRDVKIYSYLNQFYKKIKKAEEADLDLKLKDFRQMMDLELESGESGSLARDFEDADVVKIMTVHAAKGLEFKYVFLPNLVDKQFPSIHRGEKIELPEPLVREKTTSSSDFHLEEERRLFYVALTRAKDELYLTAAKDYGGAREKKPSKFITEMGIVADSPVNLDVKGSDLIKDLEGLDKIQEESVKLALPDKFSFSQFAAYSSCPLQYKFAFLLKIPAATKNQFIFGQLIHRSLYEFLLPLVSAPQASLFGKDSIPVLKKENLLKLYRDNFSPENWESAGDREKYYREGEKNLALFFDSFLKDSLPQILFLEKSFTIKINKEVIKGTIDRIDKLPDGTCEIADYKTGSPKKTLDYAAKRQLFLYQIVAEELLGLKVSSLAFYYLQDGSKFVFSAKDKDLEKFKLEIREIIEAIKRYDFSPTPDEITCRYCDFNDICEFRKI
ncbi:MAG: ATP-dependent DNA helicase [Patescibacteria group bacterium]